MAERTTGDGCSREIPVCWESFPDEKDWTWEPEIALQEDVPDIMEAWNNRSNAKANKDIYTFIDKTAEAKMKEEEVPVYVVEAILGKKKFKGSVHYLVKWKGYPLVGDRTWELSKRLKIDVPKMVDLFEESRRSRRRTS